MLRTVIQPLEEAMGLPKGVRLRALFGFWFIRPNDFKKVVAQQCYILTHEFVTSKLMDEFDQGGWTNAHKRPILLDLDREMKAFAKSKEEQ